MIKLITYNISWKSMTGLDRNWNLCNTRDEKDRRWVGVCVDNIKNTIDNKKYDFILLQEATNYKKLIEGSKYLKHMQYLHSKSGKDEIITFWNKKYIPLNYKYGEFKRGRPWQYVEFKEFTLINIHAPHISLDNLLLHLAEIINHINNRIIIGGDFNNMIDKKKIKINGRTFYNDNKMLYTCCQPNNLHYYFDHIIDTKKTPHINIKKVKLLSSDHLPITGRLSI